MYNFTIFKCLLYLRNIVILSLSLTLIISCKKEKSAPVSEPPIQTIPADTSIYACKNLPAAPLPFGWRDTTSDPNKNINTYLYNPANPDQIIYVVEGDLFGYNKMFCFDVPLKKTTYLASISDFPPQINKYGWILYSTNDNEVFKVKTNGDSIVKLTIGNKSKDPKWDFTDKNYYIFQMPYNTYPSMLAKLDQNNFALLNFPLEMPNTAAFKKSNKIIYLKTNENTISLIQREINAPNAEKILLTIPFSPTSTSNLFDNLTLDQTDENVYWSNTSGILKCNLSSLKVDTVLKNCANIKYDNPIFQSFKPNSILLTAHLIQNINAFQLLHTYKAIEYNVLSKEKTEVKIFP